MRKILLILFLFPVISYGQVTITGLAGGFQTSGVGGIGSVTMNVGKLYIIFAGTSNSLGTPATVSLSGTGQTWTEIGTAGGGLNSTSGKRIQAFRFAPTSTNTNTINFTYTGTQDGGWAELYEITGADVGGTNGSNAIVQSAFGFASTANPSATMSSLQNMASVIFAVINDVNPFTGTEESGWVESVDGGFTTPDTGGYVMYRINTTDNTPTVTSASSNWAGFFIEIKSGLRRIIITN